MSSPRNLQNTALAGIAIVNDYIFVSAQEKDSSRRIRYKKRNDGISLNKHLPPALINDLLLSGTFYNLTSSKLAHAEGLLHHPTEKDTLLVPDSQNHTIFKAVLNFGGQIAINAAGSKHSQ